MHIVCPACQKRIQIADDKIPSERQVRLTCPACHERFLYAPTRRTPDLETPPSTPPAASPQAPTSASGAPIDITEAGPAPRALVCLDNTSHRDACQQMLPSMGYNTIHTPSYQARALAYLSQVPYECIILDATFDGSTLEANPVLACLHALPMDRRRYMFSTLCVPPQTLSTDAMTAYSQSVNLVIDQADLPSCRRILEQHLMAHKRLYRVYRELRQQLGKDF